jgi:DNA-binding response OmpR family regulator
MLNYELNTVDSNIEFVSPSGFIVEQNKSKEVNVLIIDDDDDDYRFIKKSLEKTGYKCKTHRIRQSIYAMDFLETCENPDLIILDLKMPKVSGHEILCNLRSQERFDKVFISVLSSSNNDKDIEAAYENGANGYIVKTHRSLELIDDLKYMIDNLKYCFK